MFPGSFTLGEGQGHRELGQAADRPPAPARFPSPHRDPTSGRSTPPPPALGRRRSRKAFLPQSPTSLRRAPAPGRGRPAAVATRSRGCSCCCLRRAGPERRRAQGEGREGEERRVEGGGGKAGRAEAEPPSLSSLPPQRLRSGPGARPGACRQASSSGLLRLGDAGSGGEGNALWPPGPTPARCGASDRGTPRGRPREAPASPVGLRASDPQGPAEPGGQQESPEPPAHGVAPPT